MVGDPRRRLGEQGDDVGMQMQRVGARLLELGEQFDQTLTDGVGVRVTATPTNHSASSKARSASMVASRTVARAHRVDEPVVGVGDLSGEYGAVLRQLALRPFQPVGEAPLVGLVDGGANRCRQRVGDAADRADRRRTEDAFAHDRLDVIDVEAVAASSA